AMMHVDAVRLLEEAEIQDGEIGDSLYYLSLEDAIRVLDDAGWAPERIYSTLTSQWCGCVPPLAIAAMRFTLGLRWQQLLDISGMHIDEFVDRMDEQMRYDISTRFFVRVWPDPEVCHSDCFEEARLERFEEAKAVAEELFDRLGKKLKDKYECAIVQCHPPKEARGIDEMILPILDGCEITRSGNAHYNYEKILEDCKKKGITPVASSDGHIAYRDSELIYEVQSYLGKAYNIASIDINNEKDLIKVIKENLIEKRVFKKGNEQKDRIYFPQIW
ncbi:MAG: hypothetical protein QW666_03455, partial [Candidatus Woesearchaeota archaeon]